MSRFSVGRAGGRISVALGSLLARTGGLWLLMVLWLACGGSGHRPPDPTPPPAPPPTSTPAATPLVVAVEPAPAPPAQPAEARSSVVTVSSVAGLLRAIRPGQTIELEPGTYDLGASPRTSTEFVHWEKVFDGEELVVDGVSNLTIRAAAETRPEILARPRYAWVMRFRNAHNVTLSHLVLGHTPAGSCTGGVVAFEQAQAARIEQCDLFGSGTIGVGVERVDGFSFVGSTIHNCTYGIAHLDHAAGVLFRDARFVDNAEFDLVEVSASPEVRFEQCTFANNRVDKGYGHAFFKLDASSTVLLDHCVFEHNDFDQLTNERSRLIVVGERAGSSVKQALAKPSPEFNEIYALARYQRWIVAGTQAGIVFWDPASGRVELLVKATITTQLLVQGRYLWAGSYTAVRRFDGLRSKTYLPDEQASGESLWLGAGGELLAYRQGMGPATKFWWSYDSARDRFEPIAGLAPGQAPAALGGGTYQLFHGAVVRRNGEIWGLDFLQGLMVRTKAGQTGFLPRQGPAYPGRDPRRLYEDPHGKLWAIDFEDGFLRYDDAQGRFVRDPTVPEKASDMAIDAKRGRTWLLHYTQGLHLLEGGQSHFFDLSHLRYMRALLLDTDGSVWVAGWNALVHWQAQGPQGSAERSYVVDGSTVAPGLVP